MTLTPSQLALAITPITTLTPDIGIIESSVGDNYYNFFNS